MSLRPMLAAKAPEDLSSLRYPLIASPKLDGIRCLIVNGVALSRSLKPIRNEYIQTILGRPDFDGLDGELIVGSPTDANCMQNSSSGVMSAAGQPDFQFFIFDRWDRGRFVFWPNVYFGTMSRWHDCMVLHEQRRLETHTSIEEYEEACLAAGYEGLILRDPASPYKFNRSTVREGYMLKLKRFVDFEAVVVGVDELMHNGNELQYDERGYAKHSSHKDGQVPMGMLGSLTCRRITPISSYTAIVNGQVCMQLTDEPTFSVGTGFDLPTRQALWDKRFSLIGRVIKVKSFPVGVKEKPRHPVFLGFRDGDDL